MEEVIGSILYGRLDVDIPPNLPLAQQLSVVRALTVNPSAVSRVKIPADFHPWAALLLRNLSVSPE
jgi:hypothetical protein